jgi:hypothetical protein
MILNKMVNGVMVEMSQLKSDIYNEYWNMNKENPSYSEAIECDFSSMPTYNMERLKVIHMDIIEEAKRKSLEEIAKKIEDAQDKNESITSLVTERKDIKSYVCDISECKTFDEIKNCVPEFLKSFI